MVVFAMLLGCRGEPDSTSTAPSARSATTAVQVAVGASETDREEEAAESLANWFLELRDAVRASRFETVPSFFSAEFVGDALPVPGAHADELVPALAVERLSWAVAEGSPSLTHATVGNAFARFFARWTRFEHLLFKVKQTSLVGEQPRRVTARIQMQIVAARAGAAPEELAAWMSIEAVEIERASDTDDAADDRWQVTSMKTEPFQSTIAARDLFTEVSRSTGLSKVSPRFGTSGNLGFNWHGVAAADYDRDGLLDLFIPAEERNALYHNRGDGTFDERAANTGIAFPAEGTGAMFFDYDDDGDDDLFVARIGPCLLFENRLVPDGKATFVDVSGSAGVANRPIYGFGIAVADIDGDRDLDVFVASYNTFGEIMPSSWYDATNGTPNLLLRNDGGTFVDISFEAGVAGSRWSYAAAFADYDEDGDQDLYVANDYGPNNLYRNNGDGTFEDAAADAGVLDPGNGMGVTWGDYDNDGRLDLYVMNMSSTAGNRILKRLYPDASGVEATLYKLAAGNSLFRNKGDGTFESVSKTAGGVGASWAWGGGFLDFDNDGCDDLFVANGFISGKSAKDT